MSFLANFIIKAVISIALAIVLGNGSVVVFNRIPVKWYEDFEAEGEAQDGKQGQGGMQSHGSEQAQGSEQKRVLPQRLLDSISSGRQRLPSTPWKYYFTGAFLVLGIFLSSRESLAFTVSTMLMLAILLLMAISDELYMIVPDQLIMVLALTTIGFSPYYDSLLSIPLGAITGFVLAFLVWLLGKIIYKKETIGGADIKFYIVMGMISGPIGITVIFVMTSLFTGLYAAVVKFSKRGLVGKASEVAIPMMSCALLSVFIYFVFLWDYFELISAFI